MRKIYTIIIALGIYATVNAQSRVGSTFENPIDCGLFEMNTTFYYSCNNSVGNNFGNHYKGPDNQYSDDVFFKFTVKENAHVMAQIELCNSTFDTYVHLLDANGNLIQANDDACGLAQLRSQIYRNNIYGGVYYIVVEGFMGAHGTINLALGMGMPWVPRPDLWKTIEPEDNKQIQKESKLDIVLFPNPAQNSTTIQNLNGEYSSLEIIDLQGRVVLHVSIKNQDKVLLETTNLTNGLYFVRLESYEISEFLKLKIQR